MLTRSIVRLVDLSRRFAVLVVLTALAASIAMGTYVVGHFKINTDIDQLMAADLDWRVREKEMDAAFPQKLDRLVIVVDGLNNSADLAEDAAAKLARELSKKPELFKTVERPDSLPFFQKNGLLFLDEEELTGILEVLIKSQPMLGSLARDPSLRGLFSTTQLAIQGIAHGQAEYKMLEPSFTMMAQIIEANMEGTSVRMPWQSMMSDRPPSLRETRKFILVQPVLYFDDLSPGATASKEIRAIAEKMKLTPDRGVSIRLTGSVALNDEEFASVAEGTGLATILSVLLVILLLFLALRSYRLILPILITLFVGLMATTAFAMACVGSLNLISVAFAVMFVGIAVDFGIQFSVRLRDEHYKEPDTAKAMLSTAKLVAFPITFAAGSATLGFLAFIPTAYRGVSELGIIAGAGMVIAYLLNLTLLPALLSLFKPPAEKEAIGYTWMAPLDRFISEKRKVITIATAPIAVVALVLAVQVRFDFDPLNLKDPRTESVATLFDIMKDPSASPYTVEILAPSVKEAAALAAKIDALPEVDHTITLANFVPQNQDANLALIEDAKFLLDPTLNPDSLLIPPTDRENLEALAQTAEKLRSLGDDKVAASRLAAALEKVIARDDISLLDRLHYAMVAGLQDHLVRVRKLLSAEKLSLDTLTDDLRRDWVSKEGLARIEVHPKGDARDHKVLKAFTESVRAIAPQATGASVSIQESGKTVSSAFLKAGALGLVAISLMSLLVLRRFTDVVRLIFPLILAGILTLAIMVAINLPLNFANIIALPLLLSLGVTYAIYFISYWKNGEINPLQSSMARAVLFSAGTTLVAFGSLSLSSHTGTSGMGQLLTIALLCSVLSTFIVLPVLLDWFPSVKPNTET